MRKICSIQQGEKDNCWSEQSPEKSTVSTVPFLFFLFLFVFVVFFFLGGGGRPPGIYNKHETVWASVYIYLVHVGTREACLCWSTKHLKKGKKTSTGQAEYWIWSGHSKTDDESTQQILKEFPTGTCSIRIIIATVAFVLGIQLDEPAV